MAKLDIGDAILTFYGDTNNLDLALAGIAGKTQAALDPAAISAQNLAQTMVNTGQAGSSLADAIRLIPAPAQQSDSALQNMAFALRGIPPAAQEAVEAQTEAAESVTEMAGSYREARGEVMLLGEATGVHLPRHVASFLAEIPAVQGLLETAFAATAVFFLLDALVKLTEKASEWISDTFIFTEAQKNLNNELIDSNKSIVEYNKQLDELVKQYDLIGTKGSQKTALEFSFTVKDYKDTEEQIRAIRDNLFAINQGWRDSSSLIPVVNQMISKLHADMKPDDLKKQLLPDSATQDEVVAAFSDVMGKLNAHKKVLEQQQANDEKIFDGQQIEEAKAANAKRIALFFELAKAHADLDKQLEKGADDVSKQQGARLTQELKDEEKVADEAIRLSREKLAAVHAALDGEMTAIQDSDKQKTIILGKQYDVGLVSAGQYMARLKALYSKDLSDLIAIINAKEQVVILEAQAEAATRGKILSAADAKETKAYVDLENQKRKITDQFTKQFIVDGAKRANMIMKEVTDVRTLTQAWNIFSNEFAKEAKTNETIAQGMADSFKTAVDGMESGIQDAFSAMIDGSQSAGQAIEKAMFKTIGSIASQWAKFFIAKGIADVFDNPGAAAAEFAAGVALEALAGVMGGLGNSGSKSSAAGSGPPAITQNASTSAGGASTGVVNVPHLADGGLVMSPTLAMVGDAPGGEAIIPLHDAAALSRLATAIAAKMPQQAGGGGGPLQIHLQSDIPLTVRKISQKVNKGQARLLSSNSIRVTRRSV